ncbi:MAG: 4-hydroxy-2-oxovalerate aldolase [Nitrospinales bacterium]
MFLDSEVPILDTTLRDGSYVIDFQFTARDTEILSHSLEKLGVRLIEVGHGLGINASLTKGRAAASDLEYVRAARAGTRKARIGMFCIPGIARLEDLRACIDEGLQFVRIGINIDKVETSEPFIAEAKKLGLYVCTNFMKSYALPPEEFSRVVKLSADYGSDLVYLVDSAGSMLPSQVIQYIQAMRSVVDLPIGFHGHNNLNLAVANCIAAMENGASLVDSSLLGMGRCSGNTPTEVMVIVLRRHFGVCKDLDPILIIELAEQAIAPLLKNRWDNTEKVVLGCARVHSMYSDRIRHMAGKEKKLFYSLIAEVGELDCLNLSEETLAKATRKALPADVFSQQLGNVSLVKPDSSSPDEIARMAVKLNLPIHINVSSENTDCEVKVNETEIHVTCSPAHTTKILKFEGMVKKKIVVNHLLQASSSPKMKVGGS